MSRLERWLEDPRWRRRLWHGLLVLAVLILVAEIVLVNLLHLGHGHFAIESWPGFGSIYGLLSCVVIIVVSKLLGHLWLMKRRDYYDD
jgi:hypothetical protein